MKGEDFTEEFEYVCALCKGNVSSPLKIQLEILATQIPDEFNFTGFDKIHETLPMFSEVVTLLKIVLINPSTNSASERSFSAMRRIKTYLRSSMSKHA